MPYEVIRSKAIFQGKVFDVRQDEIRLPDGKTARLDVVYHPGAVVILPLDETGKIWFIRQYRHSAGEVLLELPAGSLEEDEPAEVCARREVREEIGMAAGSMQKLGEFFLAPGYSTEFLHVFLGRDLKPDPLSGDEDEFIEVEMVPVEQAFDLAFISQVRDAQTLAALLLARHHLLSP